MTTTVRIPLLTPWSQALRTWLDDHEPTLRRTTSRPIAIAWVLALYVGGWGHGLYAAVRLLLGHDPSRWDDRTMAISWSLQYSATGILVTAAAILSIIHLAGRDALDERVARPTAPRLLTILAALAVAETLSGVGFIIGSALSPSSFPGGYGRYAWIVMVPSNLLAGPTEELALLIASLLILRSAGFGWRIVLPALVILRLSFHIYYGWATIGLILWATGVVFVYLATRSAWGLVLGHSLFDILTVPGHPGWQDAKQGFLVLCAFYSYWLFFRWWQTNDLTARTNEWYAAMTRPERRWVAAVGVLCGAAFFVPMAFVIGSQISTR